MSSNPLGGSIGYNIWNEEGDNGGKTHNLGRVGSPTSPDNAPGAEVRGTTSFSADGNIDTDYYQAVASWWRPGMDQTPISGSVNVSLLLQPNHLAGVIVAIYDAQGDFIKFGLDFVFSDGARKLLGEEYFQQFEAMDSDFVANMNQVGKHEDLSWTYPMVVGTTGNTHVIGISGFDIDMSNGNFSDLHYTMNIAFA